MEMRRPRGWTRRIVRLLGCTALHAFNMWRSKAVVARDPVMSTVFHGCTLALNLSMCIAGVGVVAWMWTFRRHHFPTWLGLLVVGISNGRL